MSIPKVIQDFVARFAENRDVYCSSEYNETQLRREFLDPFFKALGWDIDNEQGYAEAYKDVVHEDAIKVGRATKAPDYSFRIGGVRKFFVEAKRPSVGIKDNPEPAYQLRRYAWSAKLPLSILTDFEEFAVYDCRVKPNQNDKASVARVFYIRFDEYKDRWDEIVSIFSREAILKGSFDKYVESAKRKRGTAEVDAAFLKEIERWRDELARNIALRNTELSNRELNFAVQRTIDRIIFLRICEDRGIEEYSQLQVFQNGENVYGRLCEIFRRADERYNSGLFHFRVEKDRLGDPDGLTLGLTIDDRVLKGIFKSLYYPESPYEFSVLPANILGHIYEQFLGKVIRLTAGHRAVVEDKPEVKKAGGVYYTPTYIVDYIVEHTVGRLIEGKTPRQINTLRVLDPACGSGSFLLGAYQRLLDWHLTWCSENEPEKHAKGRKPKIFQGPGGDWRLTTTEKKRILLNNIYGVDIDPQAVEVTKLSLLLKVLEGENDETLVKHLRLFHERALPDLAENIKCGNSIIGPDFYENKQLSLIDEEERYRINAFDWNAEFPKIMAAGGFDTVIGNPPYVRQEEISAAKAYYQSHYKTFRSTADLYINFIEKELGLIKKTGLFGMIVSNKWLRAAYGQPLREYLAADVSVLQIVDLAGLPVFANATVRTIILICSPRPKQTDTVHYLAPVSLEDFRTIHSGGRLQELVDQQAIDLPVSGLSPHGWALSKPASESVLHCIRQDAIALHEYVSGRMFRGVVTGRNKVFIVDRAIRERLIAEDPGATQIIKPVLAGRNIRRYSITPDDRYLVFTRRGININRFPSVLNYLAQYREDLTPKQTREELHGRKPGKYEWYEIQDTIDYYDEFEKPKIIYPDIATTCRFALDRNGYFGSNTTYFIPSNDLYLLGILNSKLAQFYFSEVCSGLEGRGTIYLRFFGQYLEEFPIHAIDHSDPTDKACHDRMVELVETMLNLHKQLVMAKTNHEKTAIQRQIDATDKQIDQLVYELYDLTDKEIRLVKEATK